MNELIICARCVIGRMHYPNECASPCTEGDHEVKATYQNYGYWRGECTKCHRVWEVDSSG